MPSEAIRSQAASRMRSRASVAMKRHYPGAMRHNSKRREINGRAAVITGAGSGIGRALAQRLAQHGCPVAICDQDEAGLAETAEMTAGEVFAQPLDVRDNGAQM